MYFIFPRRSYTHTVQYIGMHKRVCAITYIRASCKFFITKRIYYVQKKKKKQFAVF